MINYFFEGFLYLIGSIGLAIITYVALNVLLVYNGKRRFRKFLEFKKRNLFLEFLLLWYMCTVLKITGAIGMNFSLPAHCSTLWNVIAVPFVGSDIKMVILNVLLFVPYGILLPEVSIKRMWNGKKILFIGFCSSLCIELLQLFGGRLCEIDDVIANTCGAILGYALLKFIKNICSKGKNTQKLVRVVAILAVVGISICTIFQVINKDTNSAQEDGDYLEINSDKAINNIELFKVYNGTKEKKISKSQNRDIWYSWMGDGINNVASKYNSQLQNCNIEEIIAKNNGPYIEVVFQEEQSFSFCNNEQWNLKNIKHLVYCVKDGTLWYGKDKDKIEYCSHYESEEDEFEQNEFLLEEIETCFMP